MRVDDLSSTLVLNLKMIFDNVNISGGRITSGVIVTITGRSQSVVYDGQAHSLTGYNVSISDPSYTVNDFSFSGTASASGTNVGTYSMGLSASQFTNTNTRYRDVTFVVTDGYVKVTGKPVTVTADAKSKYYDGNTATDPTLTATESGLLGSDSITYSISRAQGQNVVYADGEVAGYTITPSGAAVQGNYIVSYVTAKFTINPSPVSLTANSGTLIYNGSSQSVTGFESSVSGLTFTGVSATGSGKNVGSYTVSFSGVVLNSTKDTTGNYVVSSVTNGSLTITKADASLLGLSVTSFDGTYNGSPRTITVTVAVSTGTTIKYSTDGTTWSTTKPTRTELGTTTVYVQAENSNYDTAFATGTITISRGSASGLGLSVVSFTGPYDGSAHTLTATVTVTSGTTIKYSTNGTTWSTTKPTRTEMGTTTVYVKAENSNYDTATATGTITIGKRAASELGLTVTNYSGAYNGQSHTITATVTVYSGTTIRYSTDNTNWSTFKPTRTNAGTTTVYVKAENSEYETATATATITISKAAASALGLTVTNYSGWYDGSSHTISASVSVSSGTTIEYSTNNSSWSTTKPTRTSVGTTTVYVRAKNDNYNTATATGTITISQRPTTGTIEFTIRNNPGYVEIKDYNTDETILYRYFGVNTYSVTGVPPGTYVSTNEAAGTYTVKSVSAGYTVDVTGINW